MAHEFDGRKYAKVSQHQKEWGQRLISELSLSGRERVLDMGCGDGALTAAIAEILVDGEVVGIDASEGMIAEAKKHKADNLTFALLDINEMDVADEFDVVFSNATLHWVRDHSRMLAGVHKALVVGGVTRLNFAGDGNCGNLIRIVKETMAKEKYAGHFAGWAWPWYMPSVDEYSLLAGKAGFAEVKVWGENADRTFAAGEAITGWIDQPSLVPFLRQIDGEDKRRFRDEVVQRMLAETARRDGTYFETFRRINLLARK